MIMLFLEQARGRPGARGHHVGDPWIRSCTWSGVLAFQTTSLQPTG